MAELKTKATKESALKFLKTIEPKEKQADGLALLKMFEKITGEKAVMWGELGAGQKFVGGRAIIGFGKYHYKSERSTQEGDWPLVGFSPRKQNLTLYIMMGNADSGALLTKLGKHKKSVGCLYINKLSDVNEKVLEALIKKSYQYAKKKLLIKK